MEYSLGQAIQRDPSRVSSGPELGRCTSWAPQTNLLRHRAVLMLQPRASYLAPAVELSLPAWSGQTWSRPRAHEGRRASSGTTES